LRIRLNGTRASTVSIGIKTVLCDYYWPDDKAHGPTDIAGCSISDLLGAIESDFENSLAKTVQTKKTLQTEYQGETKPNEMKITTTSQVVKLMTQESTEIDKTVAETNADRDSVKDNDGRHIGLPVFALIG